MVLSTDPDTIALEKLVAKIHKAIHKQKFSTVLTALTEVTIEIATSLSISNQTTITQQVEIINDILLKGAKSMENKVSYKGKYNEQEGGEE